MHTHAHRWGVCYGQVMHRLTLLRKMRNIVQLADCMLSAAGPAMHGWLLAWGHAKRCPVTVSHAHKLINVSKHFLPLVPMGEFEQLLGYHIFRVSGRITTWPFDTDCAKRACEQYVVTKTVVHRCKCGLRCKRAHAVDAAFAGVLCPQCNWTAAVFRQPATTLPD